MSHHPRMLLASILIIAASSNVVAQPETGSGTAGRSLEHRMVPIEGEFGDGWKQSIELPANSVSSGDRLIAWVEDGWLCARRESSDGQFDWQIVLCQVAAGILPEVQVMDAHPFVGVSYRDERYFIRESLNVLRSVREARPGSNLLEKDAILGADTKSGGYGSLGDGRLVCTAWNVGDWYIVASGNDLDNGLFRTVLRLDPWEVPGGSGVRVVGAGHIQYYHGDRWYLDDGELLVANRTLPSVYKAIKQRERIREALLSGGKPPSIDATAWFNTDDAPTWDSLKGKVVLVDFWGTWCGPCVAALPKTQALYEKYADRGLVALGIHSKQGGEQCAAFVEEHGYTFPVAVDTGTTAEAFGIDAWPTYFLIDRSGKVVEGFAHKPPIEEIVEKALAKSPAN